MTPTDSILWCFCNIDLPLPSTEPESDRLSLLWSCQTSLDSRLTLSIWLIVIGLLLEAMEWIPPKRTRLFVANFALPWLLRTMHVIRHGAIKLGEGAVVIGVAAELAIHIGSTSVLAEVRGIQDIQVAQLAKEAETARATAAKANERAALLMKGVAWRTIDPTKRDAMVAALKGHAVPTEIKYPAYDNEAAMFSGDIVGAFLNAGWPQPTWTPFLDSRVWMLVIIFRTPNHEEEIVADALVKAGLSGIEFLDGKLKEWGHRARDELPDFEISNDIREPFQIIVGSKVRFLPQYNPRFAQPDSIGRQ